MPSALNLTLKIKQTAENLARLEGIKAIFAKDLQPKINDALRDSKIVHFARVLVIDNLYIQVITEYDGDKEAYTQFFQQKLPEVFAAVFSLAETPPSPDVLTDPKAFYEFTRSLNLSSLGTDGLSAADRGMGQPDTGFFFQGYPGVNTEEIIAKFPPVGIP